MSPQCSVQTRLGSVQCSPPTPRGSAPAPSGSSGLHHDGQKVCGRVFPAGFLPPHRFSVGVQPHEHVLLLVAPLRRGVGVVLVLLDAFDQAAVGTKVPLQGEEEEEERKVSGRSINVRAAQLPVDFHAFTWRFETKISFDGCWIKTSLCNQTPPPRPTPTPTQRHPSATPLYLVLWRASDVMGIRFQAVQQNASLSSLPGVISSAA